MRKAETPMHLFDECRGKNGSEAAVLESRIRKCQQIFPEPDQIFFESLILAQDERWRRA